VNQPNNQYQPIQANCVDCGKSFVISVKDQQFMAKMKFSLPKRCLPCRHIRRVAKAHEQKLQQGQEKGIPA
jgi:hypothetical protein